MLSGHLRYVVDRKPLHGNVWVLGIGGGDLGSGLRYGCVAILCVIALVALGIALENTTGIPFDMTYRIACAAICLVFIFYFGSEYRGQGWPRTALSIALLVNIGLFFTPIFDRHSSRGEVMLFALPDVIILLLVRLATYQVTDDHKRAMRQQMILGLVVAVAFCALVFASALMELRAT